MLSDTVDDIVANLTEATPYYVLDLDAIARDMTIMHASWSLQFPHFALAYSYKTNPLSAVTQVLRSHGAHAEVVSGPELQAALDDGHEAHQIVFDGPVKLRAELAHAIQVGARIQVDSITELRCIAELAVHAARPPILSLRLAGIRDGKVKSRFGLSPAEVREAVTLAHDSDLAISGAHFNTGVHPATSKPYRDHLRFWSSVLKDLRARALDQSGAPFVVDIGGGYPATSCMKGATVPHPFIFASSVAQQIDQLGIPRESIKMVIEPGRSLVEDNGVLVASVAALKRRDGQRIAVLDAGTNLVRSISSWTHPVRFLREGEAPHAVYGAMCFENDIFGEAVKGPEDLHTGDKLVVGAAGGYDIPSANVWLRPNPPVFGIKNGAVDVIRQRGVEIR